MPVEKFEVSDKFFADLILVATRVGADTSDRRKMYEEVFGRALGIYKRISEEVEKGSRVFVENTNLNYRAEITSAFAKRGITTES